MTQGNCAARRPPPVPSEAPLPWEEEARGEAAEAADAGRWGRGAGGAGRLLGLSSSRPGAPRDRRLPPRAALFFFLPTTCLSRGPQRPQREAWRVSPAASEGRSRGARGQSPRSLRVCLPPLVSRSFVASTPRHSTAWVVFPLPLGSLQCGCSASTVSCPPTNSGPGGVEPPPPSRAHRGTRGRRCQMCSRFSPAGLCDQPDLDPAAGVLGDQNGLLGSSLGSPSCSSRCWGLWGFSDSAMSPTPALQTDLPHCICS
ncbi:PREDICTED: uncharacterized protein LOC105583997 [Cercocebus atys]|uniref:uncharacterized protein LOC105583997 n=1 Tax=Cercocebus atys TaxID=9531 RepID=UPI0005F44D93|nr:PREDICTED: uncharacterized protein LOC105583997 [Cercocebus atys]